MASKEPSCRISHSQCTWFISIMHHSWCTFVLIMETHNKQSNSFTYTCLHYSTFSTQTCFLLLTYPSKAPSCWITHSQCTWFAFVPRHFLSIMHDVQYWLWLWEHNTKGKYGNYLYYLEFEGKKKSDYCLMCPSASLIMLIPL